MESVQQFGIETDGGWFKPHGLWFSVEGEDDGWKWWCEAEGFFTENLAHQTELIFKPDAKLLRISTKDELDAFTKEWLVDISTVVPGLSQRYGYIINWPELAKRYSGIIIAPYIWEARLQPSTFWYYPWDCASGCVWDADAVQELRQLPGELDRQKEMAND